MESPKLQGIICMWKDLKLRPQGEHTKVFKYFLCPLSLSL